MNRRQDTCETAYKKSTIMLRKLPFLAHVVSGWGGADPLRKHSIWKNATGQVSIPIDDTAKLPHTIYVYRSQILCTHIFDFDQSDDSLLLPRRGAFCFAPEKFMEL